MNDTTTANDTFLKRITLLGFPTLFVWLLTFEWIARAHPGIQATTRILFILLGLVWLIQRWRQGGSLRITSVGALLLLYFAYTALLAPWAPLPFHALEIELNYVFYFSVFLFFVDDTQTRAKRNAWQFAFLQLAIIFSIFNLLLVARGWREWLSISESAVQLPPFSFRLPGLFLQHPNYEAAFLNMIIPVVFLGILNSSARKIRYSLSLLLLLFLFTSFYASSRGAWLATASSLGTVFLLFFWDRIKVTLKQAFSHRRLRISPRTIALMLFGILLLGGIGFLSYQQARSRGHGGRLDLWTIAWDIFSDAPFLGHGPGSFHILSAVRACIPPGFYLVHAHNIVLQILAESGLIGFFIFSAIIIRIIILILGAWNFSDRNKQDLIACIAILVGMMTHQLVDYAFEAPLYSVGIIYVLANISRLERSSTLSLRKAVYSNGLIVILLTTYSFGNIFSLKGAQDQYQGVLAAQDGNWEEAQTYLCRAREQNSKFSFFSFQCGFASAVVSAITPEYNFLKISSHAYLDGLEEDPYWPYHRAASASILWATGAREDGLQSMLEAQSQAPRSSILALNLAWMYAELENADQSNSYLSLAFQLNPWLWRSAEEPWKPPGEALDPQNLKTMQSSMSMPSYYSLLGWLYTDVGELERADEAFRSALDHAPLDVSANAGRALLFLKQGNLSEANKMIEIAELTSGRSSILEEVKGDFAAHAGNMDQAFDHWIESARQLLWTSSIRPYYPVIYGRSFISIDVPPQMIQPALPPIIADGFQQALNEGSDLIRAEATKLLPWFENQIHLQSE